MTAPIQDSSYIDQAGTFLHEQLDRMISVSKNIEQELLQANNTADYLTLGAKVIAIPISAAAPLKSYLAIQGADKVSNLFTKRYPNATKESLPLSFVEMTPAEIAVWTTQSGTHYVRQAVVDASMSSLDQSISWDKAYLVPVGLGAGYLLMKATTKACMAIGLVSLAYDLYTNKEALLDSPHIKELTALKDKPIKETFGKIANQTSEKIQSVTKNWQDLSTEWQVGIAAAGVSSAIGLFLARGLIRDASYKVGQTAWIALTVATTLKAAEFLFPEKAIKPTV